jgi:hypothetical protein
VTVTMYDSVDPSNIPSDVPVAGYGDGIYAWTAAAWARFTGPKLVIAVHPQDAGDVLDVESGDATNADIEGWCDRFDRPGRRAPSIYTSLSNWTAAKVAAAGRHVDWWIADYTAQPHCPAGAVACQYVDKGPYDLSLVADPSWLGVQPPTELVMTLDVARLIVWGWFGGFLGQVPPGQVQVDEFATQLVAPGANYEAVVTAFWTKYKG